MAAREIPGEEWNGFLRRFSHEHRGWIVDIEVREGAASVQVEGRERPLSGIATDRKGSEAPAIEIMLGDHPDERVTHMVAAPTCLRLLETVDGAHEGLEIETEGGVTTALRFRDPARPKTAYVM